MKFLLSTLFLVIIAYGNANATNNDTIKSLNYKNNDASYETDQYKAYRVKALNRVLSCPKETNPIICKENSKYRTFSGVCNNLAYKWWGATNTPYDRILAPAYRDGYDTPRTQDVNGDCLPGARVVANTIPDNIFESDPFLNEIFVYFAKFIAYDISFTKLAASCSDEDCNTVNRNCFHIGIPLNDADLDNNCIKFTRADDVRKNFDCKDEIYERAQYSSVTHFLDLSNVYGNDETVSQNLREMTGGLLKTSTIPGSFLPGLPVFNIASCSMPKTTDCFLTGDIRTGETVQVTVIHTIFVRYHNNIAASLALENAGWDDETIYQEARRITIAVYQNIIYKEFLPLLLGEKLMHQYDLYPETCRYAYKYDDYVYPNVYAEGAEAAFKLDHLLEIGDDDEYNNNQNLGVLGEFDSYLDGMFATSIEVNKFFLNSYLNNMFNNGLPVGFEGSSLGAINVQVGRDFAFKPYVYYLLLNSNYPTNFDQLFDFATTTIDAIKFVYKDTADIDLYVGLIGELAEKSTRKNLIGKTSAYIIAELFHKLKVGDRYFYEEGTDTYTRFTLDQLSSIKNTRMNTIMCGGGPGISGEIPERAFTIDGSVVCARLARYRINTSLWKQEEP